jgi:membrane-associated PAP2 superfamily phosphatase
MSNSFLSGAASMGFLVAAMFFLRFWRSTRERLFLFFSAAFLVLVLERVLREVLDLHSDWVPFAYSFRLGAFLLLILGIIDRNRRAE